MKFNSAKLYRALNDELARRERVDAEWVAGREQAVQDHQSAWRTNELLALRALVVRLQLVMGSNQLLDRHDLAEMRIEMKERLAHYSGGDGRGTFSTYDGLLEGLLYEPLGAQVGLDGAQDPRARRRVPNQELVRLGALLEMTGVASDVEVSSSALEKAGFRDWSWLPANSGTSAGDGGETK